MDRHPDLCDDSPFEASQFEIFEKDEAKHDPLLQFVFDAGVLRRVVPNAKAAQPIGMDVRTGDISSEEPLGFEPLP